MRKWSDVRADMHMVRAVAQTDESRSAIWARRLADIPRPRVSWCPITRKWVLSRDGRPHNCDRNWKLDEAFRHQHDAMTEGARVYRERALAARATFDRARVARDDPR